MPLPLDVVDYILSLTGCARWKEALINRYLKEKYYKNVDYRRRRVNVLECAVNSDSIEQLDFLQAKSDTICAYLGKLKRGYSGVRNITRERVYEEATGIVRCFNMCPELVGTLDIAMFRWLPRTTVKPSMYVVENWHGDWLPELFLDRPEALNILVKRNTDIVAVGDDHADVVRVINLITKTDYAVRLLLVQNAFNDYWEYIYGTIDRDLWLTGLAYYPRIIRHDVSYDNVTSLYRFIVCRDDNVSRTLVIAIIVEIMKYERVDHYYVRSLVESFHYYDEELANVYYKAYMRTNDDPVELKDWI